MKIRLPRMALVLLMGALGLGLAFGASRAQSSPLGMQPEEALYVADTGQKFDGQSSLYRLDIDEGRGQANLTLLPNGTLNYDHVDVLAATPDGARLYFIDDGPIVPGTQATLAYYDLASASVIEIGTLTLNGSNLTGFDQAAFSPNYVLYVTSTLTDRLYTIDVNTAEATELGPIYEAGPTISSNSSLDIAGADIAFGADGTFYFFTNAPAGPRGLYTLALPPVNGVVTATFIGGPSDAHAFRGLALRANGYGDLVATTAGDEIHILGKSNGGDAITPLPLMLGGAPFDSKAGDMSNGPLVLCTRTIGYWKNHDWGRSISVLGVWVDEVEGSNVLWNASGKNFSMLFAQLIAAKLNVNNATGLTVIDDAEAWLIAQPNIINPDGTINWFKTFDSNQQRQQAEAHKDALEAFNIDNKCDGDSPADLSAPKDKASPDAEAKAAWLKSQQ